MENTTQKLKLKEKISYGFGDLASVLYWQTFMLYFTYFYTDVFLIPAAIAATMFLVSRLWDGVNDPLMGIISDRTDTKWGKFRPYLLWICVPYAIIGVLTFTVPGFGMTGKIIWAYVTFILLMMLYTAINIPYTALLGVISPNSEERTSVSSIKFMFAFTAGIIVSAALLPMTKSLGSGDESIISASIQGDNTIKVDEAKMGNATIVLTAKDKNGGIIKQEFDFKVNPPENNTPEISNPVGDIILQEGFKNYKVPVKGVFAGNAGNDFEYEAESTNENIAIASVKGDFLSIEEKSVGNVEIQLTAKDDLWGENTASFYVNINKAGNNAPVLTDSTLQITLKTGFETYQLNLDNIISDPDNDNLSFVVESSNSKIIAPAINGNILSFSEAKTGMADLKIIARDGKGGQFIHTINYLIASENGNNAPFISRKAGNITQIQGFKSYALNIGDLFYDADGDGLTYEVEIINTAKGWQQSFMIFGVAFIIFFLITFKGTKERIIPPKNQKTNMVKDLKELVTNKPWLILLATTITFILLVGVRGSVTVHYFKYVVDSQDLTLPFLGTKTYDFVTLTSVFNTLGQIASLIGVLVIAAIAKKLGKKRTFIIFVFLFAFSTAIIYFISPQQLGWLFFFQVVGQFCGGPLSVLLWAMYADTADYAEWKNGRRATGLVFSASTMSQKFGWAVGAYVALTLMAQLGFKPNVTQSADSLKGLILLFTLIPAGFGIASLLISLAYPLSDARVKEIELELETRRDNEE